MRCLTEVHVDSSELEGEDERLRRPPPTHGHRTGAYSGYLPMEMMIAIWILLLVAVLVFQLAPWFVDSYARLYLAPLSALR